MTPLRYECEHTTLDVLIEEQPIECLVEHARIPIAFKVERILTVSIPQSGFAGIHLQEMTVEPAWVKDYDEIKGEGPTRWLKRFDTSHWGLIARVVRVSESAAP